MDQILSKIANLGYEIWGIFVPGTVLLLFLTFTWWCSGPLIEVMTVGSLSIAEVKTVSGFFALLNREVKFGFIAALAVAAYFAGNLLHWVSRTPKADKDRLPNVGEGSETGGDWKLRVLNCLRLSIPKSESYAPYLEAQLNEGKVFLQMPENARWEQFFPVAKAFLAAKLQTSLVSTYQNKYTLHRSLTAAAVVWFWSGVIVELTALVVSYVTCGAGVGPRWFPLLFSQVTALVLIYGFSASYQYNWKLFGNTIITEIYMFKRMG